MKFKRRGCNPRSPPSRSANVLRHLPIFCFNLEIFLVLELMNDIAGVIFFCVMSCEQNSYNPYLLKGNQANILLLCQHIHLQYCVIISTKWPQSRLSIQHTCTCTFYVSHQNVKLSLYVLKFSRLLRFWLLNVIPYNSVDTAYIILF